MQHKPNYSRRQILESSGMGLGMLGLGLLNSTDSSRSFSQEPAGVTASQPSNSLRAKAPHFAPKAKRMIHFFLNGGPSHVDTFDPKPQRHARGVEARRSLPVGGTQPQVARLALAVLQARRVGPVGERSFSAPGGDRRRPLRGALARG